MTKFRKKAVVIDAIQYNNINIEEIEQFIGKKLKQVLESETAYLAGEGCPYFSVAIETLEGTMKAMPGDYIIKGVEGEYYPCKPEIFKKTYEDIKRVSLDYGEAIRELEDGKMISREGWNGKGLFIFKQIPAEIQVETIPKMQSVPESVKNHMVDSNTELNYTNQMCIVDVHGGVNSWVASSSDTFAKDWFILE